MHDDTGSADEYLGSGARLSGGPAASLAQTAFSYELTSAPYLWDHLNQADQAHLAALVQADVVTSSDARLLLAAIEELGQPFDTFKQLDPSLGDVHNNRDVILKERVGTVAGILNTGRARREATTIAWQIACRERLLALATATSGLVSVLVETAEQHSTTVMPDFTYLHHAHPTTLGHYLLGFSYPFVRTLERIDEAYRLVNRSPAGSGSVNARWK